MAIAKKNFFKDHYDWLVAAVGVVLLAGVGALFATSLDNTPEAARAACEAELKQRTPAHKDVPNTDEVFRKLEAVQRRMVSPSMLKVPSDTNGCFLASERRVRCQKCRNPIPFGSKFCTDKACNFEQKALDAADAVRGGIDADNDGLPDAWEEKYGLNPKDPADAKLDSDGDTFTNLEEFEAKSDPKDPKSHPDYLEFLSASNFRTESLPFVLTEVRAIRDNYRFVFEPTVTQRRGKAIEYFVGGVAVQRKIEPAPLIGDEIVFQSANFKKVKGTMIFEKVKTGWRVLKYNKKEELVLKPGTEQKVRKDVSTAELERISDKRTLAVQVGVRKPVAVEEQVDLVWSRGDGKPISVTTGSKFKLKNHEYEVKKLAKDGNACKVTILDLEKNAEKSIQ